MKELHTENFCYNASITEKRNDSFCWLYGNLHVVTKTITDAALMPQSYLLHLVTQKISQGNDAQVFFYKYICCSARYLLMM